MTKMGFSDQWVKWIMMCVEKMDYFVLVNDNATSPIILGRGLRQGDPLSSYLFIICVEGLSALIQKVEARDGINGVKICNNASITSHLFFRANVDQASKMWAILSTYESDSGLAVNLQESYFFGSRNVLTTYHNNIASILDARCYRY